MCVSVYMYVYIYVYVYVRVCLVEQGWGCLSLPTTTTSTTTAHTHVATPTPLSSMQDLAKHKLWAKAVRCAPVGSVTVPPVLLRRRLDDPCSCPLLEWAPPGGPVRPLLQVCVCVCVCARARTSLMHLSHTSHT
jgi:hypothetical protein